MNKINLKKIYSLAFVGLIAMSLVGCSSVKKKPEANKKPQTSETQKGPVQTKPEKKDVIKAIKKTKTDGLTDTFTVKHANGKSTTFTVTYNEDGTTIDNIEEIVKEGEKSKTIEVKDGTWYIDHVDTKIKAEGIRTSSDKENGEPAKPNK